MVLDTDGTTVSYQWFILQRAHGLKEEYFHIAKEALRSTPVAGKVPRPHQIPWNPL